MSTRNLLHRNDIRFIDAARELSQADWAAPSLCHAWSNHEVLAHLVIGVQIPTHTLAGAVIRQHSFDRANTAFAAHLAGQRSPAQLLDRFAQRVTAPTGIGRVFPARLLLGDHVIHELDILCALGRRADVDSAALTAVLNTQVKVPNPFIPARARAAGLHLLATDTGWRHGSAGPDVTGTAAHLALALAGRTWALERLTGTGVTELKNRLNTVQQSARSTRRCTN